MSLPLGVYAPEAVASRWGAEAEAMVTVMFWNGGSWAWWQAGLMWIAMIAFWALLIWAVYTLITGVTRRPGQSDRGSGPQPGGARRILDERLAGGEISPEEYRRLREVREGGEGAARPGAVQARPDDRRAQPLIAASRWPGKTRTASTLSPRSRR